MARTEGSRNRPFPVHSLEAALVIIQAIADKGASRPMDRLLLADAVGRTPSSSEFRLLLSSSLKYGLTGGTEKSDNIAPTDLGLKIVTPASEGERAMGLVQASLKPELLGRILRHYNRNKLPDATFLKNTLQKQFGVDPPLTEECATLVVANAKFAGLLQEISGAKYIRITESATDVRSQEPAEDPEVREQTILQMPRPPVGQPAPPRDSGQARKIFVAHGKNRKPLEALKKILDQFKIPYVVAVDEAHQGRPISAKVAQLMAECNAGMFIFTKDEKFLQPVDGKDPVEIYRPSENVVYELGAASVLWQNRIIILREDGVSFPTDFRDLGYITFTGDEVGTKALELLKELVSMGLVKVQAA